MVICDRPIVEVCPVEWARLTGATSKSKTVTGTDPIRTVLQWDKDDCAAIGLVKFDLLGLGMLEVLHGCIDLVREVHGDSSVDLATIPQEDEVYDMLCRADSVGVFQVESRAQMATLPRLRPREFYDLVVEVALIRPGPIQGGSVHPYIRRRNGQEDVTYLHPLLEPSLKKTLGVPLFQEQLMQMAIDVGGFSPGDADMLRQAMGSKRSRERMERLHQRFADGAAERGVTAEVIEIIWEKLAAFASYGFPESHSVSFAYLVYASSWLKRWYPAAFCAALLDAQPMGFYAPHTLVQDARRHGVEVRTPDLNALLRRSTGAALRSSGFADPGVTDRRCSQPESGRAAVDRGKAPRECARRRTWGRDGPAVRLGISYVRGIGDELAGEIAAGRPYADPEDLARRVSLTLPQLEALATSGAFDCFGMSRREAIWAAGAVAQMGTDRHGAQRLPGIVTGTTAPALPAMAGEEQARADLWSTGVSPEGHPTRFIRAHLAARGVVTATGLAAVEAGTRVLVGGVVTHRQRPATAGGTLFVNLEDETGLINVVVSKGCWAAHRKVARSAPAMLVRGRLERSEGRHERDRRPPRVAPAHGADSKPRLPVRTAGPRWPECPPARCPPNVVGHVHEAAAVQAAAPDPEPEAARGPGSAPGGGSRGRLVHSGEPRRVQLDRVRPRGRCSPGSGGQGAPGERSAPRGRARRSAIAPRSPRSSRPSRRPWSARSCSRCPSTGSASPSPHRPPSWPSGR